MNIGAAIVLIFWTALICGRSGCNEVVVNSVHDMIGNVGSGRLLLAIQSGFPDDAKTCLGRAAIDCLLFAKWSTSPDRLCCRTGSSYTGHTVCAGEAYKGSDNSRSS